MNMAPQSHRHAPFIVQKCSQDPVLVAGLSLVLGMLAERNHVNGAAEIDDAVESNFVAPSGGVFDA
ncbi:hypothetical protein MCHUDSM44219_00963 [Mycolicibacterium chubuense]|uniref:Uncharacterized protein n=1 Tax=Mycolicibacterium chubuense TaxID=1800 RepID=A0A0J6WR00_MYCCU|nr:hypothetical protein MCHUDSM44219_00963 [Mycolicibacterium chubuense]SPX99819.1 Uncharacterised protein [Mycolicibacterium chubuense]